MNLNKNWNISEEWIKNEKGILREQRETFNNCKNNTMIDEGEKRNSVTNTISIYVYLTTEANFVV